MQAKSSPKGCNPVLMLGGRVIQVPSAEASAVENARPPAPGTPAA
jgi:hypothetical protein